MATVKSICVHGDISTEDVAEALRKHLGDRNVKVEPNAVSSGDIGKISGKNVTVCPMEDITATLAEKEKKLHEAEEAAMKAVLSIQTFHKQQQALFDEFVLLRQRYDEQKSNTVGILWTHCTKYHPDLRQIPDMEDPTTFVETETEVGNYDVGNFLGEGQFATVKDCVRKGEDKAYALKIISKDRITSFTALMRVSNEIDNLKELENPHIVTVRDVIHTESVLYIITEKGGKDLFDFFDEHPDGVPEQWAKEIVTCILKGVMYCHEQGICHRDLKPENILLSFDSAGEKCIDLKLCDFGLSTKFRAKTLLTDFCGSPGFFAPEMITHGSYYGDKADVWSMGCILLELVAGHEKFCDVWMVAYDYEILQDKQKFTESISDTVDELPSLLNFSDELNSFILKFLELRVSKRPHTLALCSHPWLDGRLDTEVQNARMQIQLTGDSGRFPAHISSPNVSSKDLQAMSIGGELENQKRIQDVFNNLSEKERHQLEELIMMRQREKHKNGASTDGAAAAGGGGAGPGADSAGKPTMTIDLSTPDKTPNNGHSSNTNHRNEQQSHSNSHHHHNHHDAGDMHLPPITPATPSLNNAKKILRKGMELADSNHFSPSIGFNSPGVHSPSAGNGAANGTPNSARRRGSHGHSPHPLQSVSESLDEENLAAAKEKRTLNMGAGGGGGETSSAKSEFKEQAAAAAHQNRVSLPNSPAKTSQGKPSLMNSNSVSHMNGDN